MKTLESKKDISLVRLTARSQQKMLKQAIENVLVLFETMAENDFNFNTGMVDQKIDVDKFFIKMLNDLGIDEQIAEVALEDICDRKIIFKVVENTLDRQEVLENCHNRVSEWQWDNYQEEIIRNIAEGNFELTLGNDEVSLW